MVTKKLLTNYTYLLMIWLPVKRKNLKIIPCRSTIFYKNYGMRCN